MYDFSLPPLSVFSHGLLLALLAGGQPFTETAMQHAVPAASATSADFPKDPALRTGTLPNGLRYYVRANASPKNRAELRLVVNAGSILEDEDQQGMAHFLEHMAFNGTKHFPKNTLINFVETAGMRFGADLNAYTSYDETVYMLTVPTDESRFLTQGLQVIEDWAAGGITIDSAEVVAERGVVLGEWRSRLPDTASQTVQQHYDTLIFGDSRYHTRKPIGLPELLKTAQPAPLRRFYKDWYRPDLMAVVAVGDFDPKQMEQEIRKRFGAIPRSENPRARVVPLLASRGDTAVDVYRGRVAPSVDIAWPVRPIPTDASGAYRQTLVTQLLLQHVQRWFLGMREEASRPFVFGGALYGRPARPLELMGMQIIAWPDSLERAMVIVATELERAAQHGIPAATLARQKAATLRELEHRAASAAARSSKAYAAGYSQHYLTDNASSGAPALALLSAEQDLALARKILPTITPDVIAETARQWRTIEGRHVFVRLPDFASVRPPTKESVLAIFDSVMRTPLAPDPRQGAARVAADAPLLEKLPSPGRIVSEKRHAKAGITEWILGNGARVLVKPTASDADEVLVRAWSPGGFSLVPDSLFFNSGRMVARMMTEAAGLGSHDREGLLAQLEVSGIRDFRVEISYADEEIAIAGPPRELETLFQMLHLQFTAPKLDTAALAVWKNYAKYQGARSSIDDQFDQLFAGQDPRRLPVSTSTAELARLDAAMAVYKNRFGNAGDFTFTFVGDFTPQQVRPLVERYVASLPATGAKEQPKPTSVRPYESQRTRTGRRRNGQPKASTLLVYDGLFPSTPTEYLAERERLGALGTVLSGRLRDRLREELAGTYGVQVVMRTYAFPEEHYRAMIAFDAAPERMDEMLEAFVAVLDTVRTTEAKPEELARVATIQRRQLETQLESNAYWMSTIGLYARLGIPFDRILSPYTGSVSPGTLRAAAARYLPSDVYYQIVLISGDSTKTAGK